MNAPSDLENKWNNILHDCGWQLTLTLINHHQGQIAELQQLAEETVTNDNQIVLPEYITKIPDTPVRIENAIQDLLCKITLTNKRLRKNHQLSPSLVPRWKPLKPIKENQTKY